MDIYLYISMYIQAEYGRYGVFKMFLNFNYYTCSILFIVTCCLLRLRVAEEFLFISARRRAYHL